MFELWIIEKRDTAGQLDMSDPQPEKYFGHPAITGMSEDAMAKAVWRYNDDAVLTGQNIPLWPSLVHPGFTARRKTW